MFVAFRSARAAFVQHSFRPSRRGFASAPPPEKFPTGVFWFVGAVAAAGAGTYYYLELNARADAKKAAEGFKPTKDD